MIPNDFTKPGHIIIYEGYEMTGKTTALDHDSTGFYNPLIYKPNYLELLTDSLLKRGNRFLPGLITTDLFSHISPEYNLVLDRWSLSSVVYMEYYDQVSDSDKDCIIKSSIKALHNTPTTIYYMYHKSRSSAKIIYDQSHKDNNHNDIYDLSDFDEYIRTYNEFNQLFLQWIDEIKNIPYIHIIARDCLSGIESDISDVPVLI